MRGRRRFMLGPLVAVVGAVVGCFRGNFLEGQPCAADEDCGLELRCEEGICGGFTCPVALIDGTCPCLGPTSYACTELTSGLTNKIDLLFVIDNSDPAGIDPERLVAVLESLQQGLSAALSSDFLEATLGDYRIGITTTDAGNPWCVLSDPERGALVLSSCRGRLDEFISDAVPSIDATSPLCLERCELDTVETLPTRLDGGEDAVARAWIEGGPTGTNLAADITLNEALACVLPQGLTGCGFEQPLESMYLALTRSDLDEPSDPNYGFLRDDAHLLVTVVTNEVDCSYNPDWETIFLPDGDRAFWADSEALAPSSAVCWNAGVRCIGEPGGYEDCVPASYDALARPTDDASLAVLYPVSRYQDLLEELRAQKRAREQALQVVLTLIAGAPGGYGGGPIPASEEVEDPQFQLGFGIGPGCGSTDGYWGLPPVRMRAVAEGFRNEDGDNNIFSICGEDFGGAFDSITKAVGSTLPPICMQACVADKVESQPGVQPECRLSYDEPTSGQVAEIGFCSPDLEGRPELGDGESLCYFSRVGAAVSPQCLANGWNMQFGFLYAEGFEIPETIYASCEPSLEPERDCPVD